MTRSPEDLTAERGTTHGDYPTMSKCVMDIMRVYEAAQNWDSLPETVQVFLFNNAQKCARILTGNPYEPDHYDDIAGYAHLARKSISPEPVPGVGNPDLAAAPVSTQAPDLSTLGTLDGGLLVGGTIDASKINTSDLRGSATEPVVIYPDGRALDLSQVLLEFSTGRSALAGGPSGDPGSSLETLGTTLGSVGDSVTTQASPELSGTAPGAPAETAPTSQEGDSGLAPLSPQARFDRVLRL